MLFAAGREKRSASGDGDERKKRRVDSAATADEANDDWVPQAETEDAAEMLFDAIDGGEVVAEQPDGEPVVGPLTLRDIEDLPELVLDRIARQLDPRTLFELCLLSPTTAYKFAGVGTVLSGEGLMDPPAGFEDTALNFGVIRGLFFSAYGLSTDVDELPADVPLVLRKALSAELAPYITRTVSGQARTSENAANIRRANRLRMVQAWRLFRRMYLQMSAPTEPLERDMFALGGFYPQLSFEDDRANSVVGTIADRGIILERECLAYRFFYPIDFLEPFFITSNGSYVFGDEIDEMGAEDFESAGARLVSIIELCSQKLWELGPPVRVYEPIVLPTGRLPVTVADKYADAGTAVLDENEEGFFDIDTDDMFETETDSAFVRVGSLAPGKATLVALGRDNALVVRHVSRDGTHTDESYEVNGNVELGEAAIRFASFDVGTKTLIAIVEHANVGEENLANVAAAIFLQAGRPAAAVHLDDDMRVAIPITSGNTIYTLRSQADADRRLVPRTLPQGTVDHGILLPGERVPSNGKGQIHEFTRVLSVTSISADGVVTKRRFTLLSPRQLVLRFSEDFNVVSLALAEYEREATFSLPLDPRFFPVQDGAPLMGVLGRTTPVHSVHAGNGKTPSLTARIFSPSKDLERYTREFKESSLRIGMEMPPEQFPLPVVRVFPDEADFGVDEDEEE